jgi:site-specific DNA-methyltransferase (adenine-specific)
MVKNVYAGGFAGTPVESSPLGRFPANVIHDGSDEVVNQFPNTKSGAMSPDDDCNNTSWINALTPNYKRQTRGTDSGSASRFFYCAKASKSERNKGVRNDIEKTIGHNRFDKCENCGGFILQNQDRPSACHCEEPKRVDNIIKGNHHPTVKPVSLMRYLCRMITPKNGTILDPFMGSGSTGVGAKVEGFSFIGIEREEEYCKIARARIDAWEEEVPPKPKFVEPTLF